MKITLSDLIPLSTGAALLGTGGGGDPYIGRLALQARMADGAEPEVIDVDSLRDDALVVPLGMIGSPSVALEKLHARTYDTLPVRRIEALAGRPADAIIPFEIGGMNSLFPLITASATGLPVIDGDGMGRAYPTIERTAFNFAGVKAGPVVIVNAHGESVVVDSDRMERLERLCRPAATELGGAAAAACYMMTGRQAKTSILRGTLSLALGLGRSIVNARATKQEPFQAILDTLKGRPNPTYAKLLFDGKIADLQRKMSGGYNIGSGVLNGQESCDGETATFAFQNEFLYLRRGGVTVASVPDLVCVLDRETAQPITCENLRYGQRVKVLGIAADPAFRTPEAIRICGPRSFGLDQDFEAIEAIETPLVS